MEQPCERQDSVVSGMLALHTGLGLSTADRFAWLSEAGPYSGRLNSEPDTDRQQSAAVDGSTAVGDAAELSFLEDCAAVGVPHDTTSLAASPLSMVRQSSPVSRVSQLFVKYTYRYQRCIPR